VTDLHKRIKAAKRVYIVGNGGSYANSIHLCGDLVMCKIRAYTIDQANLTRIGNDEEYANVFSSWIEVMGEPGDLLIAMSGSGKSPNILKACETAERLGMDVYRLFGNERGQDIQSAEEHQIRVGHELLRAFRK